MLNDHYDRGDAKCELGTEARDPGAGGAPVGPALAHSTLDWLVGVGAGRFAYARLVGELQTASCSAKPLTRCTHKDTGVFAFKVVMISAFLKSKIPSRLELAC